MKKTKKAEKNEDFDGIVEEFDNADNIVKKLREKLKKCTKEKQEYLDGWQRSKADFINYKKQEAESKKELIKFAKENFIVDLLSVLDSFDMAFANKDAWEKIDKNWRVGITHIYTQFLTILKENDLTQIDPKREEFNPEFHDSIEPVLVDEKENDGKIIEVLQKGYKLHDKIIRPAKVKVGKYKK